MRKILITGGAGFIGSNFTHRLFYNAVDTHITVLDKLTYAGRRENLRELENSGRFAFMQVDLVDREQVFSIVKKENFDQIVHMAAESHVDRSITSPADFIQTNIIGTANLLDAIREEGWHTEVAKSSNKKFIHVSTDEVYGSLGPTGLFTEQSPFRPNSPYSASKASADLLIRASYVTYGLPVISTFCSNNYGPYQFPEKFIPVVIKSCLYRSAVPVYGRGLNVRDWIHVHDHCDAIETILDRGVVGQTYNIGASNEWRNIDIARLICQIMDSIHPEGSPHNDLIQYVGDRPGHDFRYAIDSTKMETELGWKAQRNFADGIRGTIEWYIANPWALDRN